MPARTTAKVVIPATVKWGDQFTATVTNWSRSEVPWFRAEASQGELVYAQYARPYDDRGIPATFTCGPTPAADETQPATGRVAAGYWQKNGTFREVASATFNVEP